MFGTKLISTYEHHVGFNLKFPPPSARLDSLQLSSLIQMYHDLYLGRERDEMTRNIEKEILLIKEEEKLNNFDEYVRQMDIHILQSLFDNSNRLFGDVTLPENFGLFFYAMQKRFDAIRAFSEDKTLSLNAFFVRTYRYNSGDLKAIIDARESVHPESIQEAVSSLEKIRDSTQNFNALFGVKDLRHFGTIISHLECVNRLIKNTPSVPDLKKIPSRWFVRWAILFCQKGVDFLIFSNIFTRVGVFWDCLDQQKALVAYQNIQKSFNKRSRLV